MSVSVDIDGIARINQLIGEIAGSFDTYDLLDQIGGIVETQTRRRIDEDKESPEGKPWRPWSEDYAKTRHKGHSLLINEGNLLDSIQYHVDGDTVEVGSNLVYAATHQGGDDDRGQFARPFLGLSKDDEAELMEVIKGYIASLMR